MSAKRSHLYSNSNPIPREVCMDICGHYKYLSARDVGHLFGVSHQSVLNIVRAIGRKTRLRGQNIGRKIRK